MALPILFGGYSKAQAFGGDLSIYGQMNASSTLFQWTSDPNVPYTVGVSQGTSIEGTDIVSCISGNQALGWGSTGWNPVDITGNIFVNLYENNTNCGGIFYGYIHFIGNGLGYWTLSGVGNSFIGSFTYSTTTATANILGYWNATTTPYITERLSFWQFSNTLGKESYEQITATTTGYFNYSFSFLDPYDWTIGSTTTAPIYDSFTLNASLDQYDENKYVPFGINEAGYIINLDATSTEVSAITQYNASDFTSNPRALALYPEYECSITSFTGCIKNAFIWAFYPTQEALDNWSSLLTLIQTKAPVGYFYMARDSIGGLSATSTKAFNVVIPTSLKQYIFTPFDTGIAAILWFFFIFNFYKRLKTITI